VKTTTSCDDLSPSPALRKLRFKTDYEHDLWVECSRLISNWHHLLQRLILSRLLEHKQKRTDAGIDEIKNISPIAWQHINLHGRYDSRNSRAPSAWTPSFQG